MPPKMSEEEKAAKKAMKEAAKEAEKAAKLAAKEAAKEAKLAAKKAERLASEAWVKALNDANELRVETEMGLQEGWDDITVLLEKLATYCVSQNFVEGHALHGVETLIINRARRGKARKMPVIRAGSLQLEDADAKRCIISIENKDGDPKWEVVMRDGAWHSVMV
jgi:hypothetical protein